MAAAAPEMRYLVVKKGEDNYIFRYTRGDEVTLFYSLMQYASDDRFNFDLKDLVSCTSRLLKNMKEGPVVKIE